MTWDDKRNERQLYQILCVPRLLEYIEDDIDYRTVLDMIEINSSNENIDDLDGFKLDICEKEDCYPNINNIFLPSNNLNHDEIITNKSNPPNSFREVSLVFSKSNITKVLNDYGITYDAASVELAKYGKRKPIIKDKEAERIINSFINTTSYTDYFDKDVITSFVNMYKNGSINNILSYHLRKAHSKAKRNSDVVGTTNLIFNINVDKLRTLCFGIESNNMSFNPHEDREIFILDYVSICWTLYMLLVFHKICGVVLNDESLFFEHFYSVIQLAMFTGMKMFVQFNLSRCYDELYEELRGFKTINDKYMFVDDVQDKQQLYFIMKNADFLNEAYRNEYNNPDSIPITNDVKTDKHLDIEFCIKRGSINNSVLFEVSVSGQNPIGRIYSCETNPDIVINMTNRYYYGLSIVQPVVYLFRQILNYSNDEGKISYYTEMHNYLNQFNGKKVRNLVPKYLEIILLILHERPNKKELKQYINKHFAPTDNTQKTEFRRIYKELENVLQPKKVRLIDKLRREIWDIVW